MPYSYCRWKRGTRAHSVQLVDMIKELEILFSEYLEYSPSTGEFRWKKTAGLKRPAGKLAGCVSTSGYRRIGFNGKVYQAHRLAWYAMTGDLPPIGYEIDHINRNRSDNRSSNLRVVTRSENMLNKAQSEAYDVGVVWDRSRDMWRMYVDVNGRRVTNRYFNSKEEALKARRSVVQTARRRGYV